MYCDQQYVIEEATRYPHVYMNHAAAAAGSAFGSKVMLPIGTTKHEHEVRPLSQTYMLVDRWLTASSSITLKCLYRHRQSTLLRIQPSCCQFRACRNWFGAHSLTKNSTGYNRWSTLPPMRPPRTCSCALPLVQAKPT